MSDCLFCKIVAGDIPADKLYEDEDVLAFKDISPEAPLHVLVIPKKHIESAAHFSQEDDQLFGKMMRVGAQVAKENGFAGQFRTVLNSGAEAGQVIFHVHMHILAGRAMQWPPG